MIKKNSLLCIIILLGLLVTNSNLSAQCDSDDFLDNCAELLDDFTFVKSFDVKTDKKTPTVEFSSVFSRDHTYMITICSGQNAAGKKMIVNLYDRDKKLVSSSYFKPKNIHVQKLSYKCTATGVYYIEAHFEDQAEGCGVTILGFKKE